MNEPITVERLANNPYMIRYIDHPSQDLQLAAVRANGLLIQYLSEPDRDVQEAAVAQAPIYKKSA